MKILDTYGEFIRQVIPALIILTVTQFVSLFVVRMLVVQKITGIFENNPYVPSVMGSGAESLAVPLFVVAIIIAETAVILILIKFGLFKKVAKAIFLVIAGYIVLTFVLLVDVTYFGQNGISLVDLVLIVIPVTAVILLWKFPEWYVIDLIGIITCATGIAVIGTNIAMLPIMALLIILALYDAYSVYGSKHMLTLAEAALNLKLPMMFVIPKIRGYSFIKSGNWEDITPGGERTASFIGMGDIVVPSLLFASSINYPSLAIGAAMGSWVGLVALEWYAHGHPKAHAGLPFLNGFTIGGFAIAYLLAGVMYAG
jgi:presenilin-like A22 family membrane protease